jgi:hypothetical protein
MLMIALTISPEIARAQKHLCGIYIATRAVKFSNICITPPLSSLHYFSSSHMLIVVYNGTTEIDRTRHVQCPEAVENDRDKYKD